MSTLSSTPAYSSLGSVTAPTPARVAGNRFDKAGGSLSRVWEHMRAAWTKRAAVAELNSLDDRMLADIGLSRSEIRAAVSSAAGFGPDLPVGAGVSSSYNDNIGARAA